MNEEIDFPQITKEKREFHDMVYTPLSEAIKILEERQKDKNLIKKIEKLLDNNIPEPLKKIDKNGVMFRQVATPNFEARWFMELTKDNDLRTNFFEYHDDKFTSNNCYKHSLAQLIIHKDKKNKKGEDIEEKITVVDFAKYDGLKLKEVETLWGEPIIDFHKRLFFETHLYNKDFNFCEISNWLKLRGDKAVDYYTNFILLFTHHGILFENFLFNDEEGEFTKNVFLPAFKKAHSLSGLKPLIVPIPPMDAEIEEDIHWHSHNCKIKNLVNLN